MTKSVKKPAKLKKRILTSLQQKQHNFAFGFKGELQAIEFLKQNNFEIIDTNIRIKNSEVDIIALDKKHQELVFCEVKARATSYYGDPSHAVNRKKIKSMDFVARNYLKRKKLNYDYRFDIIAITPDGVEHYENVTWS
ncbi:MAG: YraN family protein [Patescibacteria group bacterium]